MDTASAKLTKIIKYVQRKKASYNLPLNHISPGYSTKQNRAETKILGNLSVTVKNIDL